MLVGADVQAALAVFFALGQNPNHLQLAPATRTRQAGRLGFSVVQGQRRRKLRRPRLHQLAADVKLIGTVD